MSTTDGSSKGPRLQLATPARPSVPSRPALTPAQRGYLESRSVDRSHFANYPISRWSPEGEKGEAYVSAIHHATTIAERIEAWRCLFAGVDGQGKPLIRTGRWWWAKAW